MVLATRSVGTTLMLLLIITYVFATVEGMNILNRGKHSTVVDEGGRGSGTVSVRILLIFAWFWESRRGYYLGHFCDFGHPGMIWAVGKVWRGQECT